MAEKSTSKVIDLERISDGLKTVRWDQYKIKQFTYKGLLFKIHSNSNLQKVRFVLDNHGWLQVRIHPSITWGNILGAVIRNYSWCQQQVQNVVARYDQVAYYMQRSRTYTDGGIVYIWGMPFFLKIDKDCSQNDIVLSPARQVMAALQPKGTTRFAPRFYALSRCGYLNAQTLHSIPLIVNGRPVLPKHSLWADLKPLYYEDDNKVLHNLYLRVFLSSLNQIVHNWANNSILNTRILTAPEQAMVNEITRFYFKLHCAKDINFDTLIAAGKSAEGAAMPLWRAIETGSSSSNKNTDRFQNDPLACSTLDELAEVDQISSFFGLDLWQNNAFKLGIREQNQPITLSRPPHIDYNALPHNEALLELLWQRGIYALPNSDDAKLAAQYGVYQDLSQYEATLVTTNGVEIDPCLAMVGYLPNDTSYANVDPKKLSLDEVIGLSTHSFPMFLSQSLINERIKQEAIPYFHKTLVRPGILHVQVKGSCMPSEDTVRDMLLRFAEKELRAAADNFFKHIKSEYVRVFLTCTEYMDMPTMLWFDNLDIRKMKPLGQYRYEPPYGEIRLNRSLVHYPINVMASVILHELCHIPFCNHGKSFSNMLSLFGPGADNVTDSIIRLGLISLD